MLGGTGDTSSDNISVNSRYSENLRIYNSVNSRYSENLRIFNRHPSPQTLNIGKENSATDIIRK